MNSGKTIDFFYLFQHWTNAMREEKRAHQIASAKKFRVALMTVFVKKATKTFTLERTSKNVKVKRKVVA